MHRGVSIRLAEGLFEQVPWLVGLPRGIVGTVELPVTEIVPVQCPRHLFSDAVHEHIRSAQPVEEGKVVTLESCIWVAALSRSVTGPVMPAVSATMGTRDGT